MTLNANCTDQELSAAVGMHVAHVSPRKQTVAMNAQGTGMALWEDEYTRRDDVIGFCNRHSEYHAEERDLWPEYATSADSVLPLLEKEAANGERVNFECDLNTRHPDRKWFVRVGNQIEYGPTLARTASLALCRAHGVTISNP